MRALGSASHRGILTPDYLVTSSPDRDAGAYYFINMRIRSIGMGKIMVLFLSVAISVSVCR